MPSGWVFKETVVEPAFFRISIAVVILQCYCERNFIRRKAACFVMNDYADRLLRLHLEDCLFFPTPFLVILASILPPL